MIIYNYKWLNISIYDSLSLYIYIYIYIYIFLSSIYLFFLSQSPYLSPLESEYIKSFPLHFNPTLRIQDETLIKFRNMHLRENQVVVNMTEKLNVFT